MAVPVHERKQAELAFLSNSEKLESLTVDIVMNEKYVPKKYRYVWTHEAFKLSMDIFENVRRGNILFPRNEELLKQRIRYLRLAETDAEALLSQIAFARNRFPIPQKLFEEWEKLCVATKRSIRGRINGDYERFKEKQQQ